jgi:hypothetical protein
MRTRTMRTSIQRNVHSRSTNIRSTLLVFLLLAAAHQGYSQGHIVPGGITARVGPPTVLEVDVLQSTNLDGTCFMFMPEAYPAPRHNTNVFTFNVCLDEGVRAFLVPSNAPFSLQPILQTNYTELKYGGTQVFERGVPFYVGFYTGHSPWIMTNGIVVCYTGIYTNPVFGWAKLVNDQGVIQMLDSALEYGGAGIYAGTQTIIQLPEPPLLNITWSANNLRLWWLMSSIEFVLQQTSGAISLNWTNVTTPPTPNCTNFTYEVSVPHPSASMFYRLVSK